MNFTFSEEQEIIRDSARGFLSEHSGSEQVRAAMENQSSATMQTFGKRSPRRWAGRRLLCLKNMVAWVLVMWSLPYCKKRWGGACCARLSFPQFCLGANAILTAGTDSQKADYLPQIAEGALTVALANTEASGRLDAQGIEATWTRQGNGYVLNGVKRHILHGASADLLIVAAREAGVYGRGRDRVVCRAKRDRWS